VNRKEKIKFLKGLKDGTRSLSELAAAANEMKYFVFVQKKSGLYDRDKTEEEIKNELSELPHPCHVVFITNPHLSYNGENPAKTLNE